MGLGFRRTNPSREVRSKRLERDSYSYQSYPSGAISQYGNVERELANRCADMIEPKSMRLRSCWFVVALFLSASCAHAQITELSRRVLVVFNSHGHYSKSVAEYYMQKRGIPAANLCRISPPFAENNSDLVSIPWDEFDHAIRKPIRSCLKKIGREQILYIVFSFQTPYKLSSVPSGHGVSVDQNVADIWDELGSASPATNPYYVGAASRAGLYAPFLSLADYRGLPGAKMIYSVWRLDAATSQLAMGLVDKAIQAEREGLKGQACIDRRFGKDMNAIEDSRYGAGDWDLHQAAEFLRRAGVPVTEDTQDAEFGTAPAPLLCDGASFYAGWYSLKHYNDAFSWNPGAIGVHLDSASAADPRGGANWAANAIKKGITVTSGALDEPTLDGLPHVDGLVHDLLAGANVGDAFLRNIAWLKWMIVNIGDPLYRPTFSTKVQGSAA